ncbi:MAG: winged helix-turn-helix domain-containing protein, partial [Ktedonobacterales bacterium]
LARVRASLRRSNWEERTPTPGMRTFGSLTVDLEGHVVRRDDVEIRLTPTEFSLLAQLVIHAGRVLTHRQLLQRVWGEAYGDEAEYLRVYMGRLRRKIETDATAPRQLVTEPGVGYRFVP